MANDPLSFGSEAKKLVQPRVSVSADRTNSIGHGGQLIGPNRKAEYAAAVFDWLPRPLAAYSHSNVRQRDGHYVAHDNIVPPFLFECGHTRIEIQPACPTDALLAWRGSHAALRRQAYQIAHVLLEEARPRDRHQLREMQRAEGL